MDFFDLARFKYAMPTSVAEFCDIDTPFLPKNGGEFATGSPSLGSSILTTSAPSAAKKRVVCGPDRNLVKSSTFIP